LVAVLFQVPQSHPQIADLVRVAFSGQALGQPVLPRVQRLLPFRGDLRCIGRDRLTQPRAVHAAGQTHYAKFVEQAFCLFQTLRGRDHLGVFPQAVMAEQPQA